jgi:hypothetical protein
MGLRQQGAEVTNESIQESAQLTKLQELLISIDQAATRVEEILKCQVVILAFHELAGIERDVVDDLEFYIREKGLQEGRDVCVVLHTWGGDADAAYHIGVRLQNLIKDRKLVMVVPRLAKSAGTLLACAGDKIYATPITELGPVDPQVLIPSTGRYVSARRIGDSLRQAIEIIEKTKTSSQQVIQAIFSNIPIAEMGHFESLLSHVKSLLEEILVKRMGKDQSSERIAEIAERLTKGYEYHGKVLHVDEVSMIGLSIEVLEGDKLDTVYELYRRIKGLFDMVNEIIEPLLYKIPSLPPPPIRPYRIDHGLIYLPSLEGWAYQ